MKRRLLLALPLLAAATASVASELESRLVRDINPGPAGSLAQWRPVAALGRVFFVADDGAHGLELWTTDGSTNGTQMVADINPGASGAFDATFPIRFYVRTDTVLFAANDSVNGYELWRSDGTPAGTTLVKDINPGSPDSMPNGVLEGVVRNDTLLFACNDGAAGKELWASDGTDLGTALLKDINTGTPSSSPQHFAESNGKVFFLAITAALAMEPWTTDGTAIGTVLIQDTAAGTSGVSFAGGDDTYVFNDVFYFPWPHPADGGELWRSDTTSAGTFRVRDIWPGIGGSGSFILGDANGVLLLEAFQPSTGFELWRSDGTFSGTVLVKDIRPGSSDSGIADTTFATLGTPGYFSANDGVAGEELWVTDGTTANTLLMKDINPGAAGSSPRGFQQIAGNILFSANDGVNGTEVWRTDGTATGTLFVADVNPGPSGSQPKGFIQLDGSILFAADDGSHGLELLSLVPPAIPAASTWGLLLLTLAILTAGTVALRHRRQGVLPASVGDRERVGQVLWRTDI